MDNVYINKKMLEFYNDSFNFINMNFNDICELLQVLMLNKNTDKSILLKIEFYKKMLENEFDLLIHLECLKEKYNIKEEK